MKKTVLILSFFLVALPIIGSNNAGAFIEKGLSSRSAALGYAGTAKQSFHEAVYWNPSALSQLEHAQLGLMATRAYETDYLGLSSAFKVGKLPMGLFITQALVEGFEKSIFNQATGRYVNTGETTTYIGQALYLGSGVALSDNINLGASVKYISEKADGFNTAGVGLDLAGRYHLSNKTTVGLLLQNLIQPNLKWNTDSGNVDTIPFRLKLGAASHWQKLLGLVDLTYQHNRELALNLGAEYTLNHFLKLRAGLDEGNLSLGTGLTLSDFQFDFAWTNPSLHIVEDIYRFSVVINLKKQGRF